jgi:hypothetical protein
MRITITWNIEAASTTTLNELLQQLSTLPYTTVGIALDTGTVAPPVPAAAEPVDPFWVSPDRPSVAMMREAGYHPSTRALKMLYDFFVGGMTVTEVGHKYKMTSGGVRHVLRQHPEYVLHKRKRGPKPGWKQSKSL